MNWAKHHITLILVLCAIGITASGAAVGTAVVATGNQNAAICKQVNVVQREIRGVLLRQQAALSTNAYYKDHPDELAKAKVEIARDIAQFAPLTCN